MIGLAGRTIDLAPRLEPSRKLFEVDGFLRRGLVVELNCRGRQPSRQRDIAPRGALVGRAQDAGTMVCRYGAVLFRDVLMPIGDSVRAVGQFDQGPLGKSR